MFLFKLLLKNAFRHKLRTLLTMVGLVVVISRVLELPSTPAYQASTMVRSNPKALIATTSPTIVSRA